MSGSIRFPLAGFLAASAAWFWLAAGCGARLGTAADTAAAPAAAMPSDPGPAEHATASAAPAPTPPVVDWRWDGEDPGFGRSFYHGPIVVADGAGRCTFSYDDDEHSATTACEQGGAEAWSHEDDDAFMEDAALALHGGTLYVARFSDIATGCTVTAYAEANGDERWSTRLVGLGPIGHSEYLNKVELRITDDGWIAVFGWESAGRYVEVLDPRDGRTASNRKLEP
jgi:outer membrane protein assembly factor BamB